MRKIIYMIASVMMLMACGGKKAQGESVNADSDSITIERQQYHHRGNHINDFSHNKFGL